MKKTIWILCMIFCLLLAGCASASKENKADPGDAPVADAVEDSDRESQNMPAEEELAISHLSELDFVIALRSLSLGDTKEKVLEVLGEPAEKDEKYGNWMFYQVDDPDGESYRVYIWFKDGEIYSEYDLGSLATSNKEYLKDEKVSFKADTDYDALKTYEDWKEALGSEGFVYQEHLNGDREVLWVDGGKYDLYMDVSFDKDGNTKSYIGVAYK